MSARVGEIGQLGLRFVQECSREWRNWLRVFTSAGGTGQECLRAGRIGQECL